MDFITKLLLTTWCHTDAVVFVDRLTKMVRSAPLKPDVTDLLISHVSQHHDLPTDLITKRDPTFTLALFPRLTKQRGMKQKMSSSYHPQTDGQTKVMNRTIEDYLRALTRDDQDRWDEMLTMAEVSVNNVVNTSRGETPFYSNYGTHPVTPNV